MYEQPIKDSQGIDRFPTRTTPAQLEAHARAERESIRQAIAERQQRDERMAQEREQKQRQRAADELEAYRERSLDRFVKAGGTSSDWPDTWKRLRQEYLLGKMESDPVERATEQLRAAHGTL